MTDYEKLKAFAEDWTEKGLLKPKKTGTPFRAMSLVCQEESFLDKEFSSEVRNYALEELIEEKLEYKEFIALMVEIAKERNAE